MSESELLLNIGQSLLRIYRLMRKHLIILSLNLFISGCSSHLGPQTITADRFDYNTAITDSWKEQTLLNIVKIRYADMPLFVEVASIVSG